MAQDPEYFFLQTKLSGEWDTLKESQSITYLTQNISENLNDLTETKIRIVGAPRELPCRRVLALGGTTPQSSINTGQRIRK